MPSEPAVIIAGFGRFGQIVGRLLLASDIRKISGSGLRPSDFLADESDRNVLGERRYRASMALAEARDAMHRLARVNSPQRRQAFVYVTNGYYIETSNMKKVGVLCSSRSAT